MPGFVCWVLGIVRWMLGIVFWALGIVFWVLGFVVQANEGQYPHPTRATNQVLGIIGYGRGPVIGRKLAR